MYSASSPVFLAHGLINVKCQGVDYDQRVGARNVDLEIVVNYSRIIMLALMVLCCGIGSQLVEGCLGYSDWLQGR